MRAEAAKLMGGDVVVDYPKADAVEIIQRITDGKCMHVALRALDSCRFGRRWLYDGALRRFA